MTTMYEEEGRRRPSEDPVPEATMIRLLVCGGRSYGNRARVFAVLDTMRERIACVIHGDCPTGADAFADEWAKSRKVPVEPYPADWSLPLPRKIIGEARNERMAEEGRPDYGMVFPGANGTEDMLKRLEARRIPILDLRRGG